MNSATFAPWRDSFDVLLYTLGNKLRAVGLGAIPASWLKAIRISVLPAMLFGCELWGIDEVYQVLFNGKSPFLCSFLTPITKYLK